MVIALTGNPNTGKTLLFNQLTGANQHVGNFPGVTVEKKFGNIRGHNNITIVDLPGIYSLSPYTIEEIITRNFLLYDKPDGIINIVDITNIERNLYLTIQLLELGIPTVVALNMMDEFKYSSGYVDIGSLSGFLGVSVLPISALKNQGIDEVVYITNSIVTNARKPLITDFCDGAVHRCIHSVSHVIEDHADRIGIARRFVAAKLIEGDEIILSSLNLNSNEKSIIRQMVSEMENEVGFDSEAALADMRYRFIEKICSNSIFKLVENKSRLRSAKVDIVLTHKYLGLPIFLGLMFLIFKISFDILGSRLSLFLSDFINFFVAFCVVKMESYQVNLQIQNLIINGVFAGIGSILSFLPIVVVLLFFLALLEDSGYMTRVAYIMDKPLRRIGLSGKSFVPLLMGFGCSVPAIMATRTIASERDKKLTAILILFMSCSAKLPIYVVLANAFFYEQAGIVMMLMYLLGIGIAVLCAYVLNGKIFKGNSSPFIMELPNYRLPSLKSVFRLLWLHAKDFLYRAFTLILFASVAIWFLQNFDFKLNAVSDMSQSILSSIGRWFCFLLEPLGFGDWVMFTALASGFLAKEAVVSTLAVLNQTDIGALPSALSSALTAPAALSFLVFTLLYTPCIAAVSVLKREFKFKMTFLIILAQICLAWVLSFITYNISSLFL